MALLILSFFAGVRFGALRDYPVRPKTSGVPPPSPCEKSMTPETLTASGKQDHSYRFLPRPPALGRIHNREPPWDPSQPVFFLNGKPFWTKKEISRIDTWAWLDMPPYIINYAWFAGGGGCDKHISDDVEKAARWHGRGQFELFRNLIRPGSVSIDIGGHSGDTTVRMAAFSGLTISFEPQPETFVALQTNAEVNPHLVIHPYNFGINPFGGEKKDRFCYICNGGASDVSAATKACFDVTLIDFSSFMDMNYKDVKKDVSFIKIDTENFDLDILRSMVPFLLMYRPTIMVEWYVDNDKPFREKAAALLKDIDYEAFDPYALSKIDLSYLTSSSNHYCMLFDASLAGAHSNRFKTPSLTMRLRTPLPLRVFFSRTGTRLCLKAVADMVSAKLVLVVQRKRRKKQSGIHSFVSMRESCPPSDHIGNLSRLHLRNHGIDTI